MGQIRDPEQQLTQRRSGVVVFAGEQALFVAELAALVLQRFGCSDVTVASESADLFRDRVDPCPDGVAAAGDVEQAPVEAGGLVDLVEQRRTPTAGQGCL